LRDQRQDNILLQHGDFRPNIAKMMKNKSRLFFIQKERKRKEKKKRNNH